MILDHDTAKRFIDNYKRFLLDIDAELLGTNSTATVLEKMHWARKQLMSSPVMMKHYLGEAGESGTFDQDMLAAIGTLRVDSWVYLRDTRRHSIFIRQDGSIAFGVVGLLDPLGEIVGGAGGIFFTAGVVQLSGYYVCDGLLLEPILIGPGYRRSYNETLANLKRQGQFFTTCEAGSNKSNRRTH
jgi:hypothetical protein